MVAAPGASHGRPALIGRFHDFHPHANAPVGQAPRLPTRDPKRYLVMAPVYEIVRLRVPEGLILYLKHQGSAWTFRVLPVRDPDQPRLWCLRVEPCAGASLSAKTAQLDPFYTCLGMARDHLAATLAAIQGDAVAWVADQATPAFRSWLAWVTQLPIPTNFIPPDPPARSARSAASPSAAADGAGKSPASPASS